MDSQMGQFLFYLVVSQIRAITAFPYPAPVFGIFMADGHVSFSLCWRCPIYTLLKRECKDAYACSLRTCSHTHTHTPNFNMLMILLLCLLLFLVLDCRGPCQTWRVHDHSKNCVETFWSRTRARQRHEHGYIIHPKCTIPGVGCVSGTCSFWTI